MLNLLFHYSVAICNYLLARRHLNLPHRQLQAAYARQIFILSIYLATMTTKYSPNESITKRIS